MWTSFAASPKEERADRVRLSPGRGRGRAVHPGPRTGAIEIANAGTGFLAIKRAVFERLAEAYPDSAYRLAEVTDPEEALDVRLLPGGP